jgi:hypothetical protein
LIRNRVPTVIGMILLKVDKLPISGFLQRGQ